MSRPHASGYSPPTTDDAEGPGMTRDPRLAALRGALRTRRAGWRLAAALALLGALLGGRRLGWHRLADVTDVAVGALGRACRLVLGLLDTGWPLLGAAGGLALGLALSSRRGRAAGRWLQPRLTTRPVRWGALAAGLLVLLVLVVVVLPPRFAAHRHFDKASDELKAQNDVRTTLLQALAGALLATGAYLTYRQLRVTREGQITDRYTKAVDQLGSDHLDIRLGGIYALERIARDSPQDRATIEEVLSAFVRSHAPWPPPPAAPPEPTSTQQPTTAATPQPLATASPAVGTGTASQPDEKVAKPQGPTPDVQAVVTVLGRRRLPPDGLRPLDLTRVDLQGARLDGANLQGAVLYDTNLQDVRLDGANLQDAIADEFTRWPADWTPETAKDRGIRYVPRSCSD
jgi:Pentapeptide repeats (8 copies)